LILSIHYVAHINHRFSIMISILIDLDSGLILRFIHCNGRSILFLVIYLHIFKGLYYNSYNSNKITWLIGCIAYLLLMLIAFLGYVLPWGQMRLWGATVIRRLITTIPGAGKWLLIMIWGDYSVNNRTLNRFYRLHFVIPFAVLLIVVLHLIILHSKGRITIIRINKIILPFSNYFILKDLVRFIALRVLLFINIAYFPSYFLDTENSISANPLITPIHIVPEWYFLFAYCILKRFERKVIGVIILLLSIAFFPLIAFTKIPNNKVKHKAIMVIWLVNFIMLTKIGAVELVYPYLYTRLMCTLIHFIPIIYGVVR